MQVFKNTTEYEEYKKIRKEVNKNKRLNPHYAKYKDPIKKAAVKYLQDHQVERLFNSAKQRARKANMEFALTKEDIIIPDYCPLLGIKISNITGQGRISSNASIDRKDSSKGYTKENVWVVSELGNRMKSDANKKELIAFANNILLLDKENKLI